MPRRYLKSGCFPNAVLSTPSIPSATSTVDGTVDSLLLPVLPLLGPVVAGAVLLLPRDPFLDLLAVEEQHLAGLVVGNAGAIDPAADEVHLHCKAK